MGIAFATITAVSAVTRGLADHLIAGLEVGNPGAYFSDYPAGFMPWDKRKVHIPADPFDGFIVCGAKPTRFDIDQHLARFGRLRAWDFLQT